VISVGLKELLRPDKLAQHLQELLSRPDRLREVSDNAWKLIGRQVDRPDDLLMSLLMGNRYAQS
jgi:hypothetical protein